MKITINTNVLSKENISLGEFLLLLLGYYGIDYSLTFDSLVKKKLIEQNLFKSMSAVLSNNTKDLVARIMMESDEKAINSGLNFEELAATLREYYPDGKKAGTTYDWRGTIEEIAQKLRVLVVKYDFQFTEEEAKEAVEEYVKSFTPPYTYMRLLKYFLLKTISNQEGHKEIESLFMTIIENNREKNETNN